MNGLAKTTLFTFGLCLFVGFMVGTYGVPSFFWFKVAAGGSFLIMLPLNILIDRGKL